MVVSLVEVLGDGRGCGHEALGVGKVVGGMSWRGRGRETQRPPSHSSGEGAPQTHPNHKHP